MRTKTDRERWSGHSSVTGWLYCIHCERAYKEGEYREEPSSIDGSMIQMCPYEGCDGDASFDALDWTHIRHDEAGYERYPEIPERDKEYPLYGNDVSLVFSHHGRKGKIRKVTLSVGKKYIVVPVNPRATRNRGREVELVFLPQRHAFDNRCTVMFLDTNRMGKVSGCELLSPPAAKRALCGESV